MGILLNNQKTNIRYQDKDIVLYEPTKEQEAYIKNEISENMNLNSQEEKLVVSVNLIKYILTECTSLKDDVENIELEELSNLIDNGNNKIKKLMREIGGLFDEYIEDLTYESSQKLKQINSILNALNSKGDLNTTYKKLEKVLKKYKINIDLNKLDSTDPSSVKNLIEEMINKTNNK